jgi:hypothetical protein
LLLALGQGETACEVIDEALTLPRAFRAQLGRVWGQMLTQRSQEALAARWLSEATLQNRATLDLPEAFALHFLTPAPRSR